MENGETINVKYTEMYTPRKKNVVRVVDPWDIRLRDTSEDGWWKHQSWEEFFRSSMAQKKLKNKKKIHI